MKVILLLALALSATAATAQPLPVPKTGTSCPWGYAWRARRTQENGAKAGTGSLCLVLLIWTMHSTLAAEPSFPRDIQGAWQISSETSPCTASEPISETSILIEDKQFHFWETACTLSRFAKKLSDTYEVKMVCRVLEQKPFATDDVWHLTRMRNEPLLVIYSKKTGAIMSYTKCR